jgi:hypothetical protein
MILQLVVSTFAVDKPPGEEVSAKEAKEAVEQAQVVLGRQHLKDRNWWPMALGKNELG